LEGQFLGEAAAAVNWPLRHWRLRKMAFISRIVYMREAGKAFLVRKLQYKANALDLKNKVSFNQTWNKCWTLKPNPWSLLFHFQLMFYNRLRRFCFSVVLFDS
jgi:hypothetical protein